MKLNLKKVATQYSAIIDGYHVQFGWYDSGRAFIAENGKLLKALDCYKFYVPDDAKMHGKHFIYNCIVYDKTIDGIVRFLRYITDDKGRKTHIGCLLRKPDVLVR